MTDFCHLHNHTHYSLLDAACSPQQLIRKAKEYDHKAIALTDHGVMFGCMEFYKIAQKEKIKPLLGFEAYVANGSRFDRSAGKAGTKKKNYYHLLLLAKNMTGYRNLLRLTSLGHTEGYYYKPRIDEELIKKYHEGIIACSACLNGVVNAHLLQGDYATAMEKAKFYYEIFGDDFYIELQDHKLPEDEIILRDVPKIAKETGIKLVATNDIHYIDKEHAVSHNVYLLIKDASADSKNNIEELRYRVPQMYYKTSEEMFDLFKDYPEALEATQEIADKCDLTFEKKYHLPDFPIPENSDAKTLDDYLREQTYEGIEKRYSEITDIVKKRTEYELEVIIKMGFSGYFLIVQDFINAAKKLDVRVGPGRGSAAGSIVAYALGITNVDPLPYDLLFERFLNPERVSMPDIDIDFSDEKRDLVIQYVKEKYGEESVAQIVTFGKLSSKAVLKDVGRVVGIHHTEINKITANIPSNLGKVMELKEALNLSELKYLQTTEKPEYKKLIKHSLQLEGLYRNTGTHAAGVVITPGNVVDYVPLYHSPSAKNQGADIATQYGMDHLEDAGLLKMDFLGLRTLSIIDNTLEMIENNYGEVIDIDTVALDDEKTFDIFCKGDTLGIFQFESNGMQNYLMKLQPKNIEEITAMNALYRPGPMENIPDFIERKHGRKSIEYMHPIMEKTLVKTYGIIVYQEQVMQLARDVGGFTLGQADILRRAMGKKKGELMDQQKSIFIEGAQKNGFEKKLSIEIFELIKKFASYGFNKSHSLAYSLLAYQTAWLKAHYTAEFIAAHMTAEINEQSKVVDFIVEAESKGIKVVPPDVNNSTDKFIAKDNIIYFSLAAIKNIGVSAAKGIMDARNEGNFTSYFDFIKRVDTKYANRKVLESLIYAGAFDSLQSGSRASLFASIDLSLDFAKAFHSGAEDMDSLFNAGDVEETILEPKLHELQEWQESEKLLKEKEFLGFYVSGHPMNQFATIIKQLSTLKMNETNSDLLMTSEAKQMRYARNRADRPQISKVRVCGIINDLRTRLTKKNEAIAFAKIEDFKGKGELVFWGKPWEKNKLMVNENDILVCVGTAENDNDTVKVFVDDVYNIYQAMERFSRGIEIFIDADEIQVEKIETFSKLCTSPNHKLELRFVVGKMKDDKTNIFLAEDVELEINEYSFSRIIDIFGEKNVKLITSL